MQNNFHINLKTFDLSLERDNPATIDPRLNQNMFCTVAGNRVQLDERLNKQS